MNTWWPETHKREMRFQFMHSMHGYNKPYFTDETGRLFRDETTHLDNTETIPMSIELGRDNFGDNRAKVYYSVLVDSEEARGAIVEYSIDSGNFETLGEINKPVTVLTFPTRGKEISGRDINYRIVHNSETSQAIINGMTTNYSLIEGMPNESSTVWLYPGRV